MDFKIIDAHFHLWFRQDTEVDGMPIRTLFNGRSLFMGRRTADGSVFMIDGRNRAEVFCQIWIMHKFRQLLLHKSLSMVFRTGTWLRWHENIPTAFFVCSMCEYIVLSWNKIIPANHTNQVLSTKGIRYPRFMQCLACRLQSSNLLYETRYLPER